MATPVDGRTRSTSSEDLSLERTITAPELAAALERTKGVHIAPPGTLQAETPSDSSNSVASTGDSLKEWAREPSTSQTPPERPLSQAVSHFNLPTAEAWRTYFFQEVAGDKYLEFQLLLMTVSTGILDAMTYTTYHVFTSKQTGNTLFLALYAFRLPAVDTRIEQNVGVSMGVFILGAVFFGHVGHLTRQRRRIWLLASNAFQAILILAAAAIRYFVSRAHTGPGAMAILALLSFAESGQIANALNVAMPELNTTMVTGTLINLCTDRNFLRPRNAPRNRRLLFFTSLLLGCFIGAAIVRHSSPSAALVVTAAAKGLLFFLFFLNKGMVEKRRMGIEEGKEEEKREGYATPVSQILWGD